MDIIKFDGFLNEKNIDLPGMAGDKISSWVNVKIDKDMPLRISRYTKSIDFFAKVKTRGSSELYNLHSKLDILQNPNSEYGIQCQLAILILLQYLKEIRSNFDASSAGFLFEDYIAGLLHGRRVGGYGKADFIDGDGKKCQIKFYREKASSIAVDIDIDINSSKHVDYYVIGLKPKDEYGLVQIWILDLEETDFSDYIETGIFEKDGDVAGKYKIKLKNLKTESTPYKLDFKKTNQVFENACDNLRSYITTLYDNVSNLNYNIETIITGVDKNNRVVRDTTKLDSYVDNANSNIDKIVELVKNVKSSISRSIAQKFRKD